MNHNRKLYLSKFLNKRYQFNMKKKKKKKKKKSKMAPNVVNVLPKYLHFIC